MARFYDPDIGRVTLDGHDLRELSLQTLRRSMALVIQEPALFSASIAECIAYGKPDAPTSEIVAAAEAANAHDFVTRLPDGYDTLVGERGMRLSGGERQRIAIARAFIMDTPLLILDEPTSSLDTKTEASLLDALERLRYLDSRRLVLRCGCPGSAFPFPGASGRGRRAEVMSEGRIAWYGASSVPASRAPAVAGPVQTVFLEGTWNQKRSPFETTSIAVITATVPLRYRRPSAVATRRTPSARALPVRRSRTSRSPEALRVFPSSQYAS